MTKPRRKMIGAMAILVMLGVSPISVTYSFANLENDYDYKVSRNSLEIVEKDENDGLGVILTEKVVDGKLEVQHYALPEGITKKDMQRRISIGEEDISGWAYVNNKAYHSGIVLFDGIASKVGDNLWEISVNNIKNSEKEIVYTKFTNNVDGVGLTKDNTWEKDVLYRVIFSGKNAENDLAIFIMKLGIKIPK